MSRAIESEQLLLASMMSHENSLVEGLDLVSAEMFSDRRHRLIFNAIIDVYRDASSVDVILVTNHLKEQGTLSEAGGAGYLAEVFEYWTGRANIRAHASQVKNSHLLRRISQFGQYVHEKAEESSDPQEMLALAEAQLIEVTLQTKGSRPPDPASIIQEMRAERAALKAGKVRRIQTNRMIFGESNPIPFLGPHLWMIGAPTSHGKSTFTADLVLHAIQKQGGSAMIFSLEDTRTEKMDVFLANITDISKKRIITNSLSPDEEVILEKAEEYLKGFPFLIYDDVRTLEAIRLKVKKEKLYSEVDIVVLDYIQNIHGDPDIYKRMSQAAVFLDAMKKELNVTIICLSQMTEEIRLKGAGELEAAADIILILKRPGKDKTNGEETYLDLFISKNRAFGETGKRTLQFSKNWTRIERRGAY